jgi:two-component system, cell cycle response regulator
MMLDIDWFKKVNDNYGHLIGDEALKDVARVIMAGIRTPDISGRIGGEEFAIILPQTQPEKTIEIAERLRRTVKSIAIPVADNKNISLTISIGIGQYSDQNQSLHEVLSLADKALYQAKEQGRNRVVLFEE